jgi:hypothetical protein
MLYDLTLYVVPTEVFGHAQDLYTEIYDQLSNVMTEAGWMNIIENSTLSAEEEGIVEKYKNVIEDVFPQSSWIINSSNWLAYRTDGLEYIGDTGGTLRYKIPIKIDLVKLAEEYITKF